MPTCRHSQSQREALFQARDYITGHQFEISHCRGCGFIVTWPQPTDQMAAYYPAGYYGGPESRRFPALVEHLQQWLYQRRVRWIESVAGTAPGRVLDVGCGRGLLLREFQRRGWEVQGSELSDTAGAYARDVLGLPVATGELRELALPSAHFKVVTLWHVLEHCSDPRDMLAEVNRVLQPGGVAFIGVPNFGGWEARLCRDKWFHLDVPRHLTHFSRATLSPVLGEHGFRERSWSGFAPEYDGFSFVQSLQSRLGLRHNLLYNFLRRGRAKVLADVGPPRWQLWVSLLLAPVLGCVALPATLIAGVLRQGGTLTVLATKDRGPARQESA